MTHCPACGFEELEPNKEVVNNEVREAGCYCPDCEATFTDDETLHWDDIDFPVWVEYESYDDDYQLLRNFARQADLYRGDYNGSPGYGDFKYTVFYVYYKVERDGSVTGPYANKGDENTL